MVGKRKEIFVVLALISIISILAGCATWPQARRRAPGEEEEEAIPEAKRPLEIAPTFRFDDIPVPAGFRIEQFESFVFRTDYSRVGLLKYKGKADPDRVVAFYKDQMSMYGWSLLSIIEYGKRLLTFEKEDQSCIITIDATRTKTILTIATSPKSKIK